jgi:hypothetical protein
MNMKNKRLSQQLFNVHICYSYKDAPQAGDGKDKKRKKRETKNE